MKTVWRKLEHGIQDKEKEIAVVLKRPVMGGAGCNHTSIFTIKQLKSLLEHSSPGIE